MEEKTLIQNGIVIDGDPNPLVAEKIYSHLTTVETKNLEEKQLITKVDRYHWFLFIALALLMHCSTLLQWRSLVSVDLCDSQRPAPHAVFDAHTRFDVLVGAVTSYSAFPQGSVSSQTRSA